MIMRLRIEKELAIGRKRGGFKVNEAPIQKSILEMLRYHPRVAFAWRNNTGATSWTYIDKSGQAKDRFVKFGIAGLSDILGFLDTGRFFAIEVKAKGGKLTTEQEHFIERVVGGNGVAGVAYSVEDAMAIIAKGIN